MDRHTQDLQETRVEPPEARTRDAGLDRMRSGSGTLPSDYPPFVDGPAERPVDLVCLSHLRWDFVFQRPQQLLTRAARDRRVFFVEEPIVGERPFGCEVTPRQGGVQRVVFHVPAGLDEAALIDVQRQLLDVLFAEQRLHDYVLWYYTPMALPFTKHLDPRAVVYDCMDELSAFAGAPAPLRARERELMSRADLVFTGGQSLYDSKRELHPRVYAFPSSVDAPHFAQARAPQPDPADQAGIPRPRVGFFGVIDERMDLDLVRDVAAERPDWQFVFLGPVVKIDPSVLPQAPNLHYLGPKAYDDLPSYLSGWDAAILPFARNDATRFISPTKTPEYLAAGRPVVSTSIRDVVRPYGEQGLAWIADTAPAFAAALEAALAEDAGVRRARADGFLSHTSWDGTWTRMRQLLDAAVSLKCAAEPAHGRFGSTGALAPPPV